MNQPTYPLPLDDPCGIASHDRLRAEHGQKHWLAACSICDYESVPMLRSSARAAVVQHACSNRHRAAMVRQRREQAKS